MKRIRRFPFIIWIFLAGAAGLISCKRAGPAGLQQVATAEAGSEVKPGPFRVLIIIGDQWSDPMSYNIDTRRVRGREFIDVATMLKIWGVPFDILRLDQQRLQINRFLDGEARPNYGCIIWMADPAKLQGYSAHYQTLKEAVEGYGISLIALADFIATTEVAELAGIKYQGITTGDQQSEQDSFVVSVRHELTDGAYGIQLPDDAGVARISIPAANGITIDGPVQDESQEANSIVHCTAADSVTVLGFLGEDPQLTVRDINDQTKVVWIGGGRDWFRKYPVMRKIFRNALVYSMGYGLFNDNFENGFIFIMDDVGCSEHAWSLRWHYPTPDRETLVKYLIEPLERYGLIMVQNITPGYANPETKMVEVPWTVEPFRDTFGNWQDYGSTKEGLMEGLRRGVFEIQPHRAWSHMNWDLDSPPGPWWEGPIDGEIAKVDWYNEVVDVRRGGVPVPSNDLLFIYRSGVDAIKKAFGVVPLSAEVRPGAELREGTHGGDDNGRIAAIAGLGVSRECYVGFDRTIEFSMMMPEQFTCHDLDLTRRTDSPADVDEAQWDALLEMTTEELLSSPIAGGRRVNLVDNTDWIESRLDKHWMGFNECCAYLHAQISQAPGSTLDLSFDYDPHYCKYFENRSSQWTLELSEGFLERVNGRAAIYMDGVKLKSLPGPRQVVDIPPGLGKHSLQIQSRNQ